MTNLILYNLDSRVRFQDYIAIAREAGLVSEAEVHTDTGTVWFKGAKYGGKDLGSYPEKGWAEEGFFKDFTQRAREMLGARQESTPPVNHAVAIPSRTSPRLSSLSGVQSEELVEMRPARSPDLPMGMEDNLYLNAAVNFPKSAY